ncbi:hypothetical protein D3C78_1124720 [compost metagenome]
MNAQSSLIACLTAYPAAAALLQLELSSLRSCNNPVSQQQRLLLLRRGRGYDAILAYLANQALRSYTDQRRGNQISLHSHIKQPINRAERAVRMNRAEHKMSGQGGAHCNFCRFRVPNFADHDDIRVLPQNRSQA